MIGKIANIRTHGTWTGLILILIAATVLRAYGVGEGLPFLYKYDEAAFVRRAVHIVSTGDLNPHWFGHPGTFTIYTLAVVYLGYGLFGLLTGWFGSLSDLAAAYAWDPSIFHAIGRVVNLLSSIANLVVLWLIARKIAPGWVALLAVAALSISTTDILLSTRIRTDIQQSALMLLVVYFALAVAREGRWRAYLASGIALGLAVTVKYFSVVAATGIIAASLIHAGVAGFRQSFPRELVRLIAAGAVSVATAFVSSPYLFLDFNTALRDMIRETEPHLGAVSDGVLSTFLFYVDQMLSQLTALGLALAVVGIIYTFRRGDRSGWVAIVVPLAYLAFLSVLPLRWWRWALPLLPFLALFSAIGVEALFEWTKRFIRQPWTAALVLAFIGAWLWQPLSASIYTARRSTVEDTRDVARRWIQDNLPRNSNILLEKGTPWLLNGNYKIFAVIDGNLKPLVSKRKYVEPEGTVGEIDDVDKIEWSGIDYVVVDDNNLVVLKEEKAKGKLEKYGQRESNAIRNYEELVSRYELVARFNKWRLNGTPISVYWVR